MPSTEIPMDAETAATTEPAVQDAADAGMEQQAAQREAILATKPAASSPISLKVLKPLVEGINAVVKAVSGDDAELPAKLPEATTGAVPDDLYLLTAAMAQVVAQADPAAAKKYDIVPTDMVDDAGVRATAAALLALAKNKKCIAAIQKAMGIGEEEAAKDPAPPAPNAAMSEDEQALAAYQ
jgi:hypothetical protein